MKHPIYSVRQRAYTVSRYRGAAIWRERRDAYSPGMHGEWGYYPGMHATRRWFRGEGRSIRQFGWLRYGGQMVSF